MFLPTTRKELERLGWRSLDVILVTGDTYIDSPFMGVSMIGKVMLDKGYKVGIIAQPDVGSGDDIRRLGEPSLFWGITGGAVDSMVANYTALKKRRKQDDYTPGVVNDRRPDRAVIAYANLVRRFFKSTVPIVLGGMEASLRRISHYDFWSGKIRRSILFDARADFLVFGMGHATILSLARALALNKPTDDIRGIGYISKTKKGMELPSFESVSTDKKAYIESFKRFYENTDPLTGQGLCQRHNDRYLVLNPPGRYSSTAELDALHALPFERDAHPFYKKMGEVRALDTIRFSIPTHYGCYGECHFCAISVHQGRTVRFRSQDSIVKEAETLTRLEGFTGYILDLGGPTANMYGYECEKKLSKGPCPDKRCLFPDICKSLKPDHSRHLALLKRIEALPGIKKVFINSGIRFDLILGDTRSGPAYLEKLVKDHVSGQMKVAPEHTRERVLHHMGKQGARDLLTFKAAFDRISAKFGKKQFLTYYLMAAHPGCTQKDMEALKTFAGEKLKMTPEQVQIFTPTPSTFSTLMYCTGLDPFTLTPIFVEKDPRKKEGQKKTLTARTGPGEKRRPGERKRIRRGTRLKKNRNG